MTVGSAPHAASARRPAQRPRRAVRVGSRAGQVVVAQAAAALVLAASGLGYPATVLAVFVAAALVLLSWGRLRGRWLYDWLGVGLRYLSRHRALPAESDAAALLALVAPGTAVAAAEVAGDAAAVLVDAYGVTVVLELGDPGGLLADAAQAVPSPADLLPAAGPEAPRVRLQMVVSAVPAPVARAGAATSATSYRQLTEGRVLGHERTLLAVRVQREEGWRDAHLHRALSGVVRKVRRRLGGTPARLLGEAALLRALADVAHHDGRRPAREGWPAVHVGGLLQATFQLTRWPNARADLARRLVPRLLSLPAAATTVSLTAGPRAGAGPARPAGPAGAHPAAGGGAENEVPVVLTVRLAGADPGALTTAVQALDRLLGNDRAAVRRLDGEQLAGLAATLPLGGADAAPLPGVASSRPARSGPPDGLELPVDAAGLMIGKNRHGAAVLARLFRAEPTRAVVVGGVRCAQLVVLRAMALGARVVVQTARPHAWEPFVRGVSTPGETIAVIPPGRPVPAAPGTPLYPLLVVVDVGPVAADGLPGAGWQAGLLVRDELTAVDVDVLGRADLVVLQPLRPDEAALAGSTLGLGDAAGWLTRIRPDMVGVVNRRTVRWALLSPTPIEQQLIGPPARG